MKNTLLIIAVLLIATPVSAQTRVEVTCSGVWVNNGDGTQRCDTSGGTGSTATPGATPVNTSGCPNGGTVNANGSCNLGYTALEPIPGLTSGTNLTAPGSLPNIINAIFKILISAGALLAVLSLTVGGVQYMVSGSASGKSSGIGRAKAALWGILLIAASWLILNTVNPQLLKFDLNPCPAGVCKSTTGGSFAPSGGLANPTPGTSNSTVINKEAGTVSTPYGTTYTSDNTNLNNAYGCSNSGGTWKYLTNSSGGWSTGGTCYIGATQTGVGAVPY
jgi:hypothetical protein